MRRSSLLRIINPCHECWLSAFAERTTAFRLKSASEDRSLVTLLDLGSGDVSAWSQPCSPACPIVLLGAIQGRSLHESLQLPFRALVVWIGSLPTSSVCRKE